VNPNFTQYTYVQGTTCRTGRILVRVSGFLRALPRQTWLALLTILLVCASPIVAGAQGTAVRPRITARVDDSVLSVLHGNIHPLARAQYDQGKVDPSLQLQRITILFQLTAAQKADLEALLAAQQNPTSPSFHQWLTPAQYGDRFGIAQSDLNQVTAWLQAQGFVIVETPPSRNLVVFSGSAAQVQAAFHTEIHEYSTSGGRFYSNASEPSVPAAIAGVIAGFRGLNNYRLKPRSIKSRNVSSVAQPNFTSSITGNNFVAPGDFATIYDLKPLYVATPPIDGTGQKIVIVGQSDIVLADIAAFRTAAGLPAKAPVVTLVSGSSDPGVLTGGDEQESSIDIEWAGAVATNATIVFVYANPNTTNGVFDALQYAISQDIAPVISVSYGGCEALFSSSDINFFVAIAQQANAQGITITSATGDGGATDCDGDLGNYPAITGLNVDIPAALPYVTGVGGTEFDEGTGTYWQPQSTSDIVNSALSYIPEKVWNDSAPAPVGLSAGGGGASSIFGKPSWQTGTGVPADGVRDVPDIAINASPSHDSYLTCVQFVPKGETAYTSSCLNGTFRYSDNSLEAYGGTSFGGPTFAGILALVNQKTGSSGQGNINYILYPLAVNSPTAFNDITTGDNKSPCTQGTEDCPDGNPIGFVAGLGYDPATGLGSVNATNLVNAWTTISTGAGSTPTLSSISPSSITAGAAGFTLTAAGSNFATNAQILWNGSTLGVTMLPNGTSTSIKANISSALVAYGTTASVTVINDGAQPSLPSASQLFTVNGTSPANDNIANAIAITSNNFVSTVDNSAATTEITDPIPPCVTQSTNPDTKTVWWSLTSGASGTVTATTIGSVYDTTLSVWTGTPGSLTNVACNDDVSGGQYTQSFLTFSATAGTKYYLMVAPYGPPDTGADLLGGKTVLNVTNANPASSQAPVITSANSTTFTVGTVGSFTVEATGNPAPTFSESGELPSGVTLSTAGVLSGKPALGSSGSYPITITAQNGVLPNDTEDFILIVNPGPTVSLAPGTNPINISAPGQAGTSIITASGSNINIPDPVTMTCAVTPTSLSDTPTCSLNTNPVLLSNTTTSGTTTLTVRTTAASGISKPASRPQNPGWPLAGEVGAFIACLFLLRITPQKRAGLVTFAIVLFAVMAVATGCGAGSSGGGGVTNPGTTPGAYTVTVTATPSTGSAQMTTITVNVQ
jgi:Pro-kumamolisin, activation domain/Putative Ig domain